MKLIVGLGNPGSEYALTYHNLGFMCIDKMALKLGISLNKAKFNSLYGQGKCGNEIVFLMKPLTYMNLSGNAVKEFADYYKIESKDIVVICDDIDLKKGTTRYREHGSAGTHNGLKNIVFRLQTEDFKRVRIGAGREENEKTDLKDYVLSRIDEENLKIINEAINEATEKILDLINDE
ncbi:MAG: aminoacyl-tRNA hydrolase [Clostridia bacterium]|nr:aminoacyl-tRNA hydrolase [Clostridia bacterium]